MGQTRILYRVVDEYGGDTLTAKRTRSSRRPLSLGEQIRLFLGAWALKDVLDMDEFEREGARDFTGQSSKVYPRFAAAIRLQIDEWHTEGDGREI